MFDKPQQFLQRMKNSYLAISVVYVIFGLCLAIRPQTSSSVICFALGLICIIFCAISLLKFYGTIQRTASFDPRLILPIIAGIFGLVIMFRPAIVISILPVIVGLILIISGFVKFQNGMSLKQCSYEKWWLVTTFALVAVGAGLLIFFNPFGTGIVFIRIVGIFFIIDGVLSIFSIISLKNNQRYL